MEDNILSLVAVVKVKKGNEESLKAEILPLLETIRNENGCINYNFHQGTQEENVFVFYENWTDRESWQAHMHSPHMQEYTRRTELFVEEADIHELKEIAGIEWSE